MYDTQQLREENRRIVDQMKIEEQKKVNEVKEKMLVEQSEMQARNDHEKKEYNNKSENQVKDLQDKVMQLSATTYRNVSQDFEMYYNAIQCLQCISTYQVAADCRHGEDALVSVYL